MNELARFPSRSLPLVEDCASARLERLAHDDARPGVDRALGYERANDHCELSPACGERALLPAVRRAPEDELIIADGFSCRERLGRQTRRVALHTARVLDLASSERDGESVPRDRPEGLVVARRRPAQRVAFARAAFVAGAGAAVRSASFAGRSAVFSLKGAVACASVEIR